MTFFNHGCGHWSIFSKGPLKIPKPNCLILWDDDKSCWYIAQGLSSYFLYLRNLLFSIQHIILQIRCSNTNHTRFYINNLIRIKIICILIHLKLEKSNLEKEKFALQPLRMQNSWVSSYQRFLSSYVLCYWTFYGLKPSNRNDWPSNTYLLRPIKN